MINKLQIKGLHYPNHPHLPGSKMVYYFTSDYNYVFLMKRM